MPEQGGRPEAPGAGDLQGQSGETSREHSGEQGGLSREEEKLSAYEILLQKRSWNKDAYPGCYDISSAGHILAGDDFLPAACREVREELGLEISPDELILAGTMQYRFVRQFHGKPFDNHEISAVYLCMKDVDTDKLVLQEEEVESVKWMGFMQCMEKAKKKDPQFCIQEQELRMIADYIV